MPTYQYACTACDERLEAVQSFTDAPLTECPACGGALRKVFSAVGVVFKGSGFYKTDSRSGGKGAEGGTAEKGQKGGDKADAAPVAASASSGSEGSSNGTKDSGSSSGSSSAKPAASAAPASKSA